ncbi:3-oxoacyl-[acyl-carrier protein] reductase [Marinospirillum celere]|uniref:3-oxoacyl-[acyl-carrier protein] reductase n=1 Tax=Marinospirillum celere TaxID=1122252 RepID=A0A1I1FTS2_9GAMM|nr:SDR family oxidoreductase [Marinospirillum celere]SFC02442.1 3-oxoacyl-[acyl-carrier protein] reductase [Marinospirillum celere]
MQVKDSVVVVTGGGQGLGRAMAVDLAAQGAKLALLDLNEEKLQETVELVREAGSEAHYYLVNVADEEAVVSTFEQIVKDFGALDVLVNNAGITRDGLLVKAKNGEVTGKMPLSSWQQVMDVNLTGVFLCGREAAAQMIKLGNKGVLINISSISRAGNMGQTNYAAAKAGVVAMTVTWSKELSRYGIRTGAVAPGFVATDMVAAMPQEVLDKITSGIPLKRLGQPEEIAHTVRYIIENDYFSGSVVECNGALRI